MKKLLIIILVVIVILILGVWLYLRISCGDIPDRLEAMKIPRYPDAKFWRITDSTNQCFLNAGIPSANIYFYSDRKPTEVLSFFKEELPKSGWNFKDEGISGQTDLWLGFVKKDGSDRIGFYLDTRYIPRERTDWNYNISITGRHSYYKKVDKEY